MGLRTRSPCEGSVRRRVMWTLLGGLALGVASGLVGLNACVGPLRVEPLRACAGTPVDDGDLELARRFAPILYHEFHPTRGRQDVLAPVDFDGDLDGENDGEHLPHYELLPTVLYALVASETHWFLSYHLFHPRDWTCLDLGLNMTHENDGENLQVVVERSSERVVLLFTQAHFRGGVYADPESRWGDGEERIRGGILLLDDEGRVAAGGSHAGVFVEQGGHGIYGVHDARARVTISSDGAATFARAGWVMRPARGGEEVREPALSNGSVVSYRLESTRAKLWSLLLSGELVGEGKLLDGTVPYADARVALDVPRYYEADRFSGPLGSDRGISPFAIDFRFGAGEVGALLFDPARRYRELLRVPEPWSERYVDYPFAMP